MTRRHHVVTTGLAAASATLLSFVLTACGTSTAPTPSLSGEPSPTYSATVDALAAFPRTVDIPAGSVAEATQLTLEAAPSRIVAVSYEAAELIAALGAADRLVMISGAVLNPALGNHTEELALVEATHATESDPDVEGILALNPDLVVLSARHGLDTGLGATLEAAGVPVLVLPNSWSDATSVAADVTLMGKVLGLEAEAEALADAFVAGLPAAPVGEQTPGVLILTNQAGQPFVTAGRAFPLELVRLAGGHDVSAEVGITRTGPITAEQVIAANPDAILLIDMNGSGSDSFAALMANDAVAGLPAVTEGRVLLVEGRQVQALGLTETAVGLEKVTAWIAGF